MHHRRSTRHSSLRPAASAFTLIEVLVVLGIIAIIATISLVVAGRITESGKDRLTSDVLKILDASCQSYVQDFGRVPTSFIDAEGTQFPIIDARGNSGATMSAGTSDADLPEPSLALFILATKSRGGAVEEALKGVDAKLLDRPGERELTPFPAQQKRNPLYSPARDTAPIRDPAAAQPDGNDSTPARIHIGLTVKDGWGNPIRFVHPAYQGGYGNVWVRRDDGTFSQVTRDTVVRNLRQSSGNSQAFSFRRSARPFDASGAGIGDADEGFALGSLPYFYSSGADKDPGTRADNVYTTRPTFPVESRQAE